MKVGILPIGPVDVAVLQGVQSGLVKVFPDTSCMVFTDNLTVPEEAFDKKRHQYNSSLMLNEVRAYAASCEDVDRVLGVIDVDIFVPGLNYVFGEAYAPGRAALISLWRLRPEFYGEKPNNKLFLERALKEAVHELGHTLGLRHCMRSFCVMHFSNSIFDTDKKQTLFCDECYLQVSIAISNLG